jgi:hypothetical protein
MSKPTNNKSASMILLVVVIVMAVLHQDFWAWDNESLVLGFMPVGLFYHAMYSLAAAGLWCLAIKFAWPHALEQMAEGEEGENPDV